jgi:hypothetical protein
VNNELNRRITEVFDRAHAIGCPYERGMEFPCVCKTEHLRQELFNEIKDLEHGLEFANNLLEAFYKSVGFSEN